MKINLSGRDADDLLLDLDEDVLDDAKDELENVEASLRDQIGPDWSVNLTLSIKRR